MLLLVTNNDYKSEEYTRLCVDAGLPLDRWDGEIQEIQEIDLQAMARQKVLEAYRWLLHPVLVDVSGMRLNALSGLPGGLNRQFWDILHANVCDLVHTLGDPSAEMVINLALCDGQRIIHAEGSVLGELATHESPIGSFHLDQIFIPAGASSVLSEMVESERDAVGPRGLAVRELVAQIAGTSLGRQLGMR
jgi:XTP/dITP diphosphohydrolase